jgi:PAS domain S-box-containing protein
MSTNDIPNQSTATPERLRLTALINNVGIAITAGDLLPEILSRCARALVDHLDAAFARVWTLNESANALELQASQGIYVSLEGLHSRLALHKPDAKSAIGTCAIAAIALRRQPRVSNAVVGDPAIKDQAWAEREGIVSFAGYPLIVGGRLVGVIAIFARKPLSAETVTAMESVSHGIALCIDRYRDLTERKSWEQRLLLQYGVSRALNAGLGLGETAGKLLAAIGANLYWKVGLLWIPDRSDTYLRCISSWHSPDHQFPFIDKSRQREFQRGEGFPGMIWQASEPRWISDFTRVEFARSADAASDGLHAAFAFPVQVYGRVAGVVEFYNDEICEPDELLLRTIATVGHQIGQYLERHHSAQALRDSELRKSAILETALDPIVTIDHESRIIEFNPAAERTFGYRRKEAIGALMPELIIPERFREAHYRGMRRYLETGVGRVLGQRLELWALRADGTEFPSELAITRIPVEGNPIFTAYLRDLSDRRMPDPGPVK